jgi:hypothetical protein
MEGTAACRLVQFTETCQVQLVNQAVNETYWVVFRNIFIDSLRKKQNLLGSVRTKVYLCHALKTWSKGTKNIGHNKALA